MQFLEISKSIRGFTLAEVLITLAVIGVVAALSIPGLINNIDKQHYKTAVKKAFAEISNAMQLYYKDNSTYLIEAGYNGYTIKDSLKEYFSIARDCDNPRRYNCFHDVGTDVIKNINGDYLTNTVKTNSPLQYSQYAGSLELTNGMFLFFTARSNTPVDTDYDYIPGYLSGGISYGAVIIDTNGYKSPNTLGKDIFAVILTTEGPKPVGADPDFITSKTDRLPCNDPSSDYSGWGCAADYLKE